MWTRWLEVTIEHPVDEPKKDQQEAVEYKPKNPDKAKAEAFLEEKDPFISESVRAGTIKPTKHIIPGKYPERLLEIVFYVPIEVAEEKIKTSVSKINDILEKQAFAHIEAKFALENAEKLTNDLHKLMAIAVVFILAGAYQYVHGFRLWLLRTQMPIDGKSKETTNA